MELQSQSPQVYDTQPSGQGLAITSLIVGIVAVLTGLLVIGGLLGIVALVFGIIALNKKSSRGMAITGIVLGSLGIVGAAVALVLATLAVPSLQQNARDTERKNQVGLAISDILQFQSENQGQLPDPEQLSQSYETLSMKFKPSGEPTTHEAVYEIGKTCDGGTSSRAFRVRVKLEAGDTYCQDS